ncbi:hypothetical protein CVT26_001039 [Gymnopilus dilepis]|uniref:2OGFeDO JBP1/TET oxygenase domain-containing protein n=1 Tax=Gymnopilus dilepis TaxID=231916 RepID=A0A409YLU9_9AGAR|nr:hypothetical protein CVT26_001039 [Gymnopilus dilepis]
MTAAQDAAEGLQITREVSEYMRLKFVTDISHYGTTVTHPSHWPLKLRLDCDIAIRVLTQAYHNTVKINWDIEKYITKISPKNNGRNDTAEAAIGREFPPFSDGSETYDRPMSIIDSKGREISWYLPGAISSHREPSSTNWRVGKEFYMPRAAGHLKPGTVSLAPAWFEQAHDTDKDKLRISATLSSSGSPGENWVRAMRFHSAIVGGILSIINPQQFEGGMATLQAIARNPEIILNHERLAVISKIWSAPFHGISIISNRITPRHQDCNGVRRWMDLLVALGEYQKGSISLVGLGMNFSYQPGTVMAVPGRILTHAAECQGDRACIAYYMRDNINTRLQGEEAIFVKREVREQ